MRKCITGLLAVFLMLCTTATVWAQGVTVTGTVTDDYGDPLIGVNVLVRGTTTGAITDIDGRYSVAVSGNQSVLLVSYVGFLPQEITVGNQRTINVVMREDAQGLDEVVVVGYGTQRKSDITGSVATVDPDKLKDRPVSNFGEALIGQMAGVQIQQISGQPGSEGLLVRVRGTASITQSSDPLYVVDGFPMEDGAFRLVTPSDIESIQILKDASSTAIYGSRGSNGVVIITTKKGQAGKPRVSFTAQIGTQHKERSVEMMNRNQYVEWFKDGRNQAWLDQPIIAGDPDKTPHTINDPNDRRALYSSASTNFMIPDGDSKYGYAYNFHDPASVSLLPDNNWQDLLFRDAMMQQYELSITGGSENTRYAFSGSFLDQEGIVRSTDYKRYNFRTNLISQITNFLDVGVNLSAFYGDGREMANGKDAPIMYALNLPPIYPVRNEDGTWGSQVRNPEIVAGDVANPLAIADDYYRWRERYGWMGSIYAEIKILKELKYKLSVNGSMQDNHRMRYLPSFLDLDGSRGPRIAESEDNRSTSRSWVVENTLTYNKTFAQKHVLTALLGATAEKRTGISLDAQMRDFPTDVIKYMQGGSIVHSIGSRSTPDNTMISYLARLNYAFDNRYILTASIRRDGSSRFGKENRWGNFPSAGLTWRISQENFMKEIEFLSDLKVRASYGLVGNNRIGDFASIGRLSTGLYPTGDQVKISVNPNTMSNDLLGWERTSQTNIGLDIGLFNNRIRLEAEAYYGKSIDLLMDVQLPTITGYSTQVQNIGQVENKGLEFLLSTKNLTGAFKWSTDFNISFNRNKVLQLGPDGRPIYQSSANANNAYITQIGSPIACYYGYVYEGVYMSQADLDKYPHQAVDKIGDGRYRDVNGDGIMDASDKQIIGNNQPNYTGGLNNSFSYKNFSLNVQMTFSQGAQLLSLFRRMCGIYHGDRNGMIEQLNRWRSPEEPGDGWHFRATRTPSGWQRDVSSAWVEDGSYLRIRNASLSYDLDPKFANKLYLRSLRVFVTGQNLYTWTKYAGFDPENSSEVGEQNARARGGDYAGYPAARAIIFGINVSF